MSARPLCTAIPFAPEDFAWHVHAMRRPGELQCRADDLNVVYDRALQAVLPGAQIHHPNVTEQDIALLDAEVVDPATKLLRLLPAAFWQAIPRDLVMGWCVRRGRYFIPTVEAVAWTKDQIGNRKAIEIGAGCGDFGIHLAIEQTDSYMQAESPHAAIEFSYALSRQERTRPHGRVTKLDGLKAVYARRPEVTIAAWVTQFSTNGSGNPWGVQEGLLVRETDYIVFGNLNVHQDKHIMALPHEELSFPWLVSRAIESSKDRVWIWKRQKQKKRG